MQPEENLVRNKLQKRLFNLFFQMDVAQEKIVLGSSNALPVTMKTNAERWSLLLTKFVLVSAIDIILDGNFVRLCFDKFTSADL